MSKQSSKVSKILEMAIKRYQFDVVGWTKFCTEYKNTEQKALLSGQLESLEMLRIRDKISTLLYTPPVQKIYDSKSAYIKWLDEEYERDQAFYEAILKNPGKYKLGLEDDSLNVEINDSAKRYLKTITERKVNEKILIKSISNGEWDEIKKSIYPKVLLGLILGASKEDIVNNFGVYFINFLKAYFAGSRTAFLSSSGPEYWHELDKCKAELTYFREEVIRPSLGILKQKNMKK
jgi:hypothetical protein